MFKGEICAHFGKTKMWLSSQSGVKRLKQCKEMTGGITLDDFITYQAMQQDMVERVKDSLNYKRIGKILYKEPNQRQKGFTFINRLAYMIFDDDLFLKIDTIESLRKLERAI